MDIGTVVTVAAAGGSAGKMVEITWDVGRKWLATYFKDHREKAVEAAEANALVFLNDLAARVKILEEQGSHHDRIEHALDDPDFAATLKTALIASARTSSAEKHNLLSRAVAERLTAQSEGLLSLSSSLAIEALPHLTSKHLTFLGLAAVINHIKPNPFPSTEPEDKFVASYKTWLSGRVSPFAGRGCEMTFVDYSHLISTALLTFESVVVHDLGLALAPAGNEAAKKLIAEEVLADEELGGFLRKVWEQGMNRIMLSSTGQLIGVYVADRLTGSTTTINWD